MENEQHIEEFLIAGTDPDIVARYEQLAKSAEGARFGLVEDDVVIVDTETTGLDANYCSLIEIAAVRMNGPEITGRFETFVDPGTKIPAEITELTGITDADVAGAPSPRQAVSQFAEFARGADLVAHNATFDRAFIMAQAEAGAIKGAWLDSLSLAQIVLPRFKTHRLADLARAFGAHTPSHRAMDDVIALSRIWRILLSATRQLQPGLARFIADIFPTLYWPLRTLFQQAADATPEADFSLRSCRSARTRIASGTSKYDANEIPLRFPTDDDIAAALSREGIAGQMYPGYEHRAEQLEMSLEVTHALRDGTFRALEAGTGVGKSMAYLLPAALIATGNAITIGVATKTNALTDQLVYHELPRLRKAMGKLSYISLKGYEHYPCLRKLEHALRASEDGDEDVDTLQALAMLCSFVAQTSWGDLGAFNYHWNPRLRARIQASADSCLKKRCPFFPMRCYLHGARRQAQTADIVVTNHALLFKDVQMDNGILPSIRHWIVDEAHAVESEARRQLSSAIAARELEATLARLTGTRAGIIGTVRAKAANLDGGSILYGITADVDDRVGQIRSVATSFFSYVKELGDTFAGNSAYERQTLWISAEVRASGPWANLERLGRSLADKLDGLAKRLRDLVSSLEQFEDAFSAEAADLAMVCSALEEALSALVLVLDGTDTSYVYSADVNLNPEKITEALRASKLDVGEELARAFYPNVASVVFTSATLATGSSSGPFEHFCRTSGLKLLDEGRVIARQLSSSYDFDHHMCVLLPSDIPEPGTPGYLDALEDLLLKIHTSVGGSVLTLFTNRREMEALYRRIKPQLAADGIELIAQTRGISTKNLRDRFLQDTSLSLFALKSFWEGFDAPGDTLRCVVIPRLPFANPDDPITREREAREVRAWWRYSLPAAVIELKQAAGRLIRNSTDSGWLVLADSRLLSKRYGKTFLNAMPTRNVRVLSSDDLAGALSRGDI